MNRGQRGRKQKTENRGQNRARAALVMRLQSHLNREQSRVIIFSTDTLHYGKNILNTGIDATEVALPTAQTKLMNRGQRAEQSKSKPNGAAFAMLFLPPPTNLITLQSSMRQWQKSPSRR